MINSDLSARSLSTTDSDRNRFISRSETQEGETQNNNSSDNANAISEDYRNDIISNMYKESDKDGDSDIDKNENVKDKKKYMFCE